jgi:arylformamidase
MPTKCIDLSHSVSTRMPTPPGIPQPSIGPLWSRQQLLEWTGVAWEMPELELFGTLGTHLVAPFQFDEAGDDIAGADLERMFRRPAVVVDVPSAGELGIEVFAGFPSLSGSAVLLRCGADTLWGSPSFYASGVGLSRDLTGYLIAEGVAIVGTDSADIGEPAGGVGADTWSSARELARAGVLLVHSMTRLDQLPATGATLSVLPAAVQGTGAIPVRPFAVID